MSLPDPTDVRPSDGPLADLPALTRRQIRLVERLGPNGSRLGPGGLLGGIADLLGEGPVADRFEVQWRAAGLRRPGVVAQLNWPRLSTRVGVGIEPPLAHALVDRLLGFERPDAEARLQVTPVEWGILSFLAARALDRLDESPGPLGPWDLHLDRVGPDPFDPIGLGPIVTWRWRVRLGRAAASLRLWVPESLLALWLLDDPPTSRQSPPASLEKFAGIGGEWTAEAGTISLSKGLAKLRPGLLLLIDGAPLTGTPLDPLGRIKLAQTSSAARTRIQAHLTPDSAAGRLTVESPPSRDPTPPGPTPMPEPDGPTPALDPLDIPAILTVELGRIHLSLARLADLKPGDVLELGRVARDPVELTSGGRLVARGELVQVDTELGVRVTQVFLG